MLASVRITYGIQGTSHILTQLAQIVEMIPNPVYELNVTNRHSDETLLSALKLALDILPEAC